MTPSLGWVMHRIEAGIVYIVYRSGSNCCLRVHPPETLQLQLCIFKHNARRLNTYNTSSLSCWPERGSRFAVSLAFTMAGSRAREAEAAVRFGQLGLRAHLLVHRALRPACVAALPETATRQQVWESYILYIYIYTCIPKDNFR